MGSRNGFKMMKRMVMILFSVVIFCRCDKCGNMDKIEGFAGIIYASKISDIFNKNKVLVLGKDIYKFQMRFTVDNDWEVGKKIYDTYVSIDSRKYKLSDLLMNTYFLFEKEKKGEIIKIDNTNILKENINNVALYGNISVYEKHIYVTIAYLPLKFGRYIINNFIIDDKLLTLNPELIIGIGQTGTL